MALYTPMNGWDGKVMVVRQGGTTALDASEIYGITWEENYNPERRKQLGTRSPGYLAGRYEANGSATGYFITGNMTKEIYGQGAAKAALRDHAARGMKEFNILIDFSTFPIQLNSDGTNAATFAITTAYTLGKFVVPTTPNGRYYKVTTAGTSGGSNPTWPTVTGNTVTSGTVVFTDMGLITDQASLQGYLLTGCLLDTDSFELQEGQYVEKPLRFQIKNIIEWYTGETQTALASYFA